ncbi:MULTISPECIES: PAS domain S-box protein [unclassified Caballeronia]|uniref:PAS domain S-box protein n=1 Tax=unclassified Caballeronia TaxID=2646786 RepID=UPI002866B3EA|nr:MULTISPECIES: PAS domain S-box protein [unclassified Caballeronia]MDR5740659.1 PAS domain S-box protein [Caballeronia sp. LZ016]MDR5808817.1 PAS domain S-box protein [Caballeronia sp. LZ019]
MPADVEYKSQSSSALPASVVLARDWAETPLGPSQHWPVALRTLCDVIDGSAQPMFIVWGPERVLVHNDAYGIILAEKRADALGRPFLDVWSEIERELAPLVDQAYAGIPVHMDDIALTMHRHGRAEEAHFAFSYTPVRAEDGTVGGFLCVCVETTQRVLAERERSAVEAQLRATLGIKTVGVIRWDRRFGLSEVNEGFLRMSGFTQDEALGKTWRELTPPEFWPESERAVSQILGTGEAVPYEKQYFRKDGSRWWGLFAPVAFGDGAIEIVLDITERKEAEKRLREREQRLRLIVESATEYAIVTADSDGRVTTWSPGAERTFGYRADEIIGKSCDALYVPEDLDAGIPALEAARARRDGQSSNTRWHRRQDGSRVFVSGSTNLLRDPGGAEIGFLYVMHDETERRRAEEELREAEERYRFAARATSDAIWDWNLASDTIQWNEAIQVHFGFAPGVIPGSSAWWKEHIHAQDREAVVASVEAVIAGDRDTWLAEYRFERSDGTYADVLDRGAVLRDKDGRAVRMVGAMHDLTRRKQAEATLRHLNETLEERVVQEVSARLKTEEALRQSQKLEAIGQLTGGVAHDFNNLLTVIRGAAQMLALPSLREEKRARYVSAIAETADRAAKLTSQLLTFARRQALKPEVFDVCERIGSIGEMLRTVVGSRVKLTIDSACDDCYVDADASQFETALVNMAVNGRDAMNGDGELVIRVQQASAVPKVRGHGKADGDYVAVSVTDTGCGIALKDLAQIFEPFFTTKEVGKGTGLGLSQAYGFAKQSGGEVDVRSAPGQGATFTIYLPRVPAAVAGAALKKAAIEDARGNGCVLLVEDNEQVGQFSTDLLSELGFETSWASNAETALRLLERHPDRYAVVFSDVVMPGMNGIELGTEVRKRHPDIPVILASGYSHVVSQGAEHDFQLLQKPYSIDELARALRHAISSRSKSIGRSEFHKDQ